MAMLCATALMSVEGIYISTLMWKAEYHTWEYWGLIYIAESMVCSSRVSQDLPRRCLFWIQKVEYTKASSFILTLKRRHSTKKTTVFCMIIMQFPGGLCLWQNFRYVAICEQLSSRQCARLHRDDTTPSYLGTFLKDVLGLPTSSTQ